MHNRIGKSSLLLYARYLLQLRSLFMLLCYFCVVLVSVVSTFGTTAPVLLFSDLLQDSLLLGLFREFLTANFAHESFLFYLQIQQFKSMPASDFMRTVARKIFNMFLKPQAKMNITYVTDDIRGKTNSV